MASRSALSISDPVKDLEIIENQIREGRFQRSLSLLTAATRELLEKTEAAYRYFGARFARSRADGRAPELRITYLRAVRSKSLSTSDVTQERRTSTAS